MAGVLKGVQELLESWLKVVEIDESHEWDFRAFRSATILLAKAARAACCSGVSRVACTH